MDSLCQHPAYGLSCVGCCIDLGLERSKDNIRSNTQKYKALGRDYFGACMTDHATYLLWYLLMTRKA